MNDTRFESCIKCTVCTTTCPVSRVNPRYPGPKQAGPDGERLRLKDGALYDEALKYCINCKRCGGGNDATAGRKKNWANTMPPIHTMMDNR